MLRLPNEAQEDDMIIGRSVLDWPGLRVVKDKDLLVIQSK